MNNFEFYEMKEKHIIKAQYQPYACSTTLFGYSNISTIYSIQADDMIGKQD